MSKRYVLDKNILTNNLVSNITKRYDLCVSPDVIDEAQYTEKEISDLRNSGIMILARSIKYFDFLQQVMTTHGSNLKLINLFTGKGTADIGIIAHILAERDNIDSLFPEEFVIVSKDLELKAVASTYKISCIESFSESES